MLGYIIIAWLLYANSAPLWTWGLWGVAIFIQVVQFIVKIYNAGKESNQ